MYVKLLKENNEELKVWEGDPESFVRTVHESNSSKYPLSNSIALYEDTYFNSRQASIFSLEIDAFKQEYEQDDITSELESLREFVGNLEIGQTVCFVGD